MQDNYLKQELYTLLNTDGRIFDFIQSGSLDGIWYWDLEHLENEWMSPKFWTTIGYDPDEKKHLASEWQDIIFQALFEHDDTTNPSITILKRMYAFKAVMEIHDILDVLSSKLGIICITCINVEKHRTRRTHPRNFH